MFTSHFQKYFKYIYIFQGKCHELFIYKYNFYRVAPHYILQSEPNLPGHKRSDVLRDLLTLTHIHENAQIYDINSCFIFIFLYVSAYSLHHMTLVLRKHLQKTKLIFKISSFIKT